MSASIGQVLCWAQRRLSDAGIEAARTEARLLVCHALGIDRAGLIALSEDAPPPGLSAALSPLLKRRATREPLAHILGYTEFYGLPFFCDDRALIPRSDSETVVDLALSLLPDERAVKFADLGTGSGCLAISVLANRPKAEVDALDVSPGALALARNNAVRNGVSKRISFFKQSWSDMKNWSGYDLVLSNPPYIASGMIDDLQPEVARFDPRLALDGGDDGLNAYREIAALGASRMKAGAWLVLEIGHDQKNKVSALLTSAGYVDLVVRKDLGGNDRAIATRLPF
ncbi:MAG: peptide chain release factor N(5)-glutamine methyltransferase [Pseudomonadota bacterium]